MTASATASATASVSARPRRAAGGPFTLSVDIGGTGIKMLVLDARGVPVTERARALTPDDARPRQVLDALVALARAQAPFDRVTLGFPGVVKDGVTFTAANLDDRSWNRFPVRRALERRLRVPVRVINDADMQGLAVVEGLGVELLLTLGTGVGSALLVDGALLPNLELGHHPLGRGRTYEEHLARAVLDRVGKKRWRARVDEAVAQLAPIFNYRRLYLGGGNAKYLRQGDLPDDVEVVDNASALLGGIAVWCDGPPRALRKAAGGAARAASRPGSRAAGSGRAALSGGAGSGPSGDSVVRDSTVTRGG